MLEQLRHQANVDRRVFERQSRGRAHPEVNLKPAFCGPPLRHFYQRAIDIRPQHGVAEFSPQKRLRASPAADICNPQMGGVAPARGKKLRVLSRTVRNRCSVASERLAFS